jgi:hypothetical protein
MNLIAWAVALLILIAVNYRAGRTWSPPVARATFLLTILPAVVLIGWYGAKFAYAIVNSEEVNRRYREGDLTYFMVDTAFAVSLGFGGLWIIVALIGFHRGRRDRALAGK